MTKDEAIQAFSNEISYQPYAKSTQLNYVIYLTLFFNSLSDISSVDELNRSHFINYLKNLIDDGDFASSTINLIRAALALFAELILHWTFSRHELPKCKVVHNSVPFFTPEQIKIMFIGTSNMRDKLWLLLGFDCGLRVQEIARLRFDNFNKSSHTVLIENSKRDKSRRVPYSSVTAELLKDYFFLYRNYFPDGKPVGYLFPGKKEGNHISPSTVSSHLKNIFKKYPFATDKHTAHSLRHSYAMALVQKKIDPYALTCAMGHSSINTTMHYIHLSSALFHENCCACFEWGLEEMKNG